METGSASPRALVAVAQTSDAALPQRPPVSARSAISRDALVPRTNVIVCLARTRVTTGGVASRAQKLAHSFRRRVLLELQRAEDLALRGGRGGEGDDEVCDSLRHLNAGARPALIE